MNSNHLKQQLSPKRLAQERRLHNLRNLTAIIFFVGSAYLIDKRPEFVSLEMALWAFGIMCAGMYPSWQYLSDSDRPPMPFMPLVGIFYVTSFGLPIFHEYKKDVIAHSALKALDNYELAIVLIGVLVLNAAFYCSKYYALQKIVPMKFANTFTYSKLINVLWIFMGIQMAFMFVPVLRSIPSLISLVSPLSLIAFGMFFTLDKQGKLPNI